MARVFHNVTTLLLTAAVLTGSLVTPAVRHSHSEGDRPHSHATDVVDDDPSHEHHGHAHGKNDVHGSRHRHAPNAPVMEELSDQAPHLHISLLGFDFTFPQEGEPTGPPVPDDKGRLVVLRITPDVVSNSTVAFADLVDLSPVPSASAGQNDLEMSPAAKSLVRPIDRILLCDSARCERSGVLLT